MVTVRLGVDVFVVGRDASGPNLELVADTSRPNVRLAENSSSPKGCAFSLAGQHDPILLAPFGSVLGLAW